MRNGYNVGVVGPVCESGLMIKRSSSVAFVVKRNRHEKLQCATSTNSSHARQLKFTHMHEK
jgi:hypothetical protein